MKVFQNILETIGNTPLVKLNAVVEELPCPVYGKIETFNPGHSIKDRMALKMLEVAIEEGKIEPGGTIIECTSGNTGMGLAIAAAVLGFKCVFTTSDKQSKEKIDLLKAVGAEVIVCPTNVEPDDERSYYSVAERLSNEIPNSFWFNQYDNSANTDAHYESTGPEIWDQTDGKITHLVVGVGTGGTVSGTSKYLKEQNSKIQVWGIDTFGSVFKKYHETGEFDPKEIYPYITEGIGEDILPKNVDFSMIDLFEKVSDKAGALAARDLARKEGILLGYSAGSALAGLLQLKDKLTPDDLVVIIFHDHGSRYVGKIYNDDWMRERGFLEGELRVSDLVKSKQGTSFISVEKSEPIQRVIALMRDDNISQLPVTSNGEIVGAITESDVINHLLDSDPNAKENAVENIMSDSFPEVHFETLCSRLGSMITKTTPAVVTRDGNGKRYIITQYDLLQNL